MLTIMRNEDVAYRILNEEAVMLNPEDNQIHLLNDVGTFIWEQLVENNKFEDLIDAICEEFDVEKNQAKQDLDEFINLLDQKGLITLVNE